jgi:tRNA(His) 5'-end guanylyltransferase
MTAGFNHLSKFKGLAHFDARAFNIPESDISNYFLWRAKNWERNSLQMYARSFFSSKQLHKKRREDMHEMLHSIGKNWTEDLSDIKKNGTWIFKTEKGIITRSDILPNFLSINNDISPIFAQKIEVR